jgi:flagellin-like hook-associated protein FlgL
MAFDRLVAITATRSDNRYVFSGDADQVAPYTADPAQPDGVSAYAGSGSTRNMPHPGGGSFRIARTAQDIFDDPGAGVFAAVHALRTALETGPVVDPADPAYHGQYQAQTAAIDAALTGIRAAQEHLNGELSFYGVVQKWVADAIDFSNKLDIRLRSELPQLTEADLATEALELGQATIHRDAAMAARAQHPRSTLFDFLG